MSSSFVTEVEGNWNIVAYPHHPECVDCKIKIKGHGLDPNVFKLHIHMINYLECILQHNSTTDQWEVSDFTASDLSGAPEEMDKEQVFRKLISGLKKLEVVDEKQLTIETNDGEQVRLERLP